MPCFRIYNNLMRLSYDPSKREKRIICYGLLAGRMVVVGYTPRGTVRRIFSMRKANDREQTRLAPYFGL